MQSPERLLDETALFLHRVEARPAAPKRQMLEQVRRTDPVLAGKKVLIVDDDIRNIFALTSLLERHEMQVCTPRTAGTAIEVLQEHAGHRHRPDGRDDAGDGRLRDDARDPRDARRSGRCRSSR